MSSRISKSVVVVLACVAVAAPSAAAKRNPPPVLPGDLGAIGQYVEVMPTSRGAVPVNSHKAKLSRRLRSKIRREAGADAGALSAIATSFGSASTTAADGAAAGARSGSHPTAKQRSNRSAAPRPSTHGTLAVTPRTAQRNLGQAVTSHSDGTRTVVVLGVLLGAALALAAVVLARRRWLGRSRA
jgi:hypothetical protein